MHLWSKPGGAGCGARGRGAELVSLWRVVGELVVGLWLACGVSLVSWRWVSSGLVVCRWWLGVGSLVGARKWPGGAVCGVQSRSLWRLPPELVDTVDGAWRIG